MTMDAHSDSLHHLQPGEERTWFETLFDSEQQGAIQRMITDPDLDALRTEDAFVTLARGDMLPRLLTWFTPATGDPDYGWEAHSDRSGSLGTTSAAVEWTFTGTYGRTRRDPNDSEVDNDSSFNGVRALGQQVELHGVTLLSIEGSKLRIRRYIDWVGLYAQLGLSVNWRIPQGVGPSESTA
jgi:hypothetical protein